MKRLLIVLNSLMIATVSGALLTSCVNNPTPAPANQTVYTEAPTTAGGYGNLPVTNRAGNFWTGYRTQKETHSEDATNDLGTQKATGVPLSSYWMPTGHNGKIDDGKIILGDDALVNWDKNKDKDAKYNVASVPLHKREVNSQVSNSNQDPSGKVLHVGLMNTNDHTSGFAAQGSLGEFDGFNFVNWQYLDYMVSWAGSTGEGVIVPPSADLTDAAHSNGVKSIGVIFLAPSAFGMTEDRAAGLFVKDKDGHFAAVKTLLAIAKYYNFDGWFINNESPGSNYNEDELHQLMIQFEQEKLKDTTTADMSLLSYANAGVTISNGRDMFELNGKKVSDIYMQDFGSGYSQDVKDNIDDINKNATEKRSSYDILSSTLSNSEIVNDVGNIDYSPFVKTDDHKYYSSLATFGFADSWTNWGRKIAGHMEHDPNHKTIKTQLLINNLSDDIQNKLYTGSQIDPINEKLGIGAFISERTPLVSNSFVTNFNKGQGLFYANNGKLLANNFVWNDRDLESIAPTYMWHITNNQGNSLQPRYDYSQVFDGGNSLKIGGWTSYSNYKYNAWEENNNTVDITPHTSQIKNNTSSVVDLYASDIPVLNQNYNLVFKASNSTGKINLIKAADVQLQLTVKDPNGKISLKTTSANPTAIANSHNWYSINGNLKDLALPKNSKIIKISVNILGKTDMSDYNLYLGKLMIDDNTHNKLDFAKNLNVEWLTPVNNKINARMTWNKSSGDVDHYDVYQIINNKYVYLGSTRNDAYFAQNIISQTNHSIVLAVKAINEYNQKVDKTTIRQFNF